MRTMNVDKILNEILKEADERRRPSDIYRIPCLLVVSETSGRTKGDILSDIRAVEGVTIVSVKSQKRMGAEEFNSITLKIDLTPFVGKALPEVMLVTKRKIDRILGITEFKYAGKPEAIQSNV